MSYQFDEYEVKRQVLELMQYNGINPYGALDIILDDEVHRFRTQDDKGGEKSGAYRVSVEDWPYGWVQDWRLSSDHVPFNFQRDKLDEAGKKYFDDEKYQEAIKRSLERQKELRAKLEEERVKATIFARDLYKQLTPAVPNDFPYLVNKKIQLPSYDGENVSGIKYYKDIDTLAIPLKDINGELQSIQWIDKDGNKRFYTHAPTKGAFYSVDLGSLKYDTEHEIPILIGEGVATMLTVYQAMGREFQPVIAAMNCGNLFSVAQAVKNKYPEHKIFIVADNDHLRKDNPGLIKARDACQKLNLEGVIFPSFTQDNKGTDWNDFAESFGLDAVKKAIETEIIEIPLRKKQAEYAKEAENLGTLSGYSFADFCKPTKGKNWLIQNWLPRESLVMIFAPSESCKGFIALDIAFAIACPYIKKWHNNFNVSYHGNVVYITGEGQNGLRKRCAGLAHYKGIPLDKINMHFVTEAVPLDDKKPQLGVDKLIANIGAACPNPDFVILDTVNCYMAGNENDTQDATRFVNATKKIISEFRCTVFLVHHTGLALENQGRARGSSVFKGALDMQYSVHRNGSTLILEMVKTKDTEKQPSLTFFLKVIPVPDFYKDDGSQETTCILEYGDTVQDELSAPVEKISQGERFARDTYRQAAEEYGIVIRNKETGKENIAVNVEDWRKVFYERTSADNPNTKKSAFQRARKILLEEKELLFKKILKDYEYYCVISNTGSFEGEIFAMLKQKRLSTLEY